VLGQVESSGSFAASGMTAETCNGNGNCQISTPKSQIGDPRPENLAPSRGKQKMVPINYVDCTGRGACGRLDSVSVRPHPGGAFGACPELLSSLLGWGQACCDCRVELCKLQLRQAGRYGRGSALAVSCL